MSITPLVRTDEAQWADVTSPSSPHGAVISQDLVRLRHLLVATRSGEGPVIVVASKRGGLVGTNVHLLGEVDLRYALEHGGVTSTAFRAWCMVTACDHGAVLQAAFERLSGRAVEAGVYRKGLWALGAQSLAALARVSVERELPPPQPTDAADRWVVWLRSASDAKALIQAELRCLDATVATADAAWHGSTPVTLESDQARLADALLLVDSIHGPVVAQSIRAGLAGAIRWVPWVDPCQAIVADPGDARLPLAIECAFHAVTTRPMTALGRQCTLIIDADLLQTEAARAQVVALQKTGRKSNSAVIILARSPADIEPFQLVSWIITDGPQGPQLAIGRGAPLPLTHLLVTEHLVTGERLIAQGSL